MNNRGKIFASALPPDGPNPFDTLAPDIIVPSMKEIRSSQFEAEVLKSNVPVLVDFYTDCCGPCRLMSPILSEIELESSGDLKVVKVDAAAAAQLSASLGVRAVPTFLVFSRGQQAGQITGARSKKEMRKWLDESIAATA